MSLHEKLMAIETIWDDICHSASDLPSPDWHEDVLKERDRNMKNRSDKLMNWDKAKATVAKQSQMKIHISESAFQDLSNAGTYPATQTGLYGPQISTLIRLFSDFFLVFFGRK